MKRDARILQALRDHTNDTGAPATAEQVWRATGPLGSRLKLNVVRAALGRLASDQHSPIVRLQPVAQQARTRYAITDDRPDPEGGTT